MKIFGWLVLINSFVLCFANTQNEVKKPITVVICSYNNKNYYQKNLESVLSQKYPNFRVIYTDDCSPDGTGDAVYNFVKNHPNGHKVQVLLNQERRKAMANLWSAIHSCADNEIIVTLDGDDWLPHDDVLDIVSSYYSDPNTWIAYSNHMRFPGGKPGISRPLNNKIIKRNGVRGHPYVVSHLRSFYAGLFKKIKLQDLMYHGQFAPATYDLAMFFPMLEMAAGHIQFMKEILYVYNCINPISDLRVHRKLQADIDKYLRKLKPYPRLTHNPTIEEIPSMKNAVDIIVFSYNRPMQLQAYLESLQKLTSHYNQVTAIYRSDNQEYEEGYEIVKRNFPAVKWVQQFNPPSDFKQLTVDALCDTQSQAEFVVFAVDDMIVKDTIDFLEIARLMKKTGAHGFYLRMGNNINFSYMAGTSNPAPVLVPIEPNVYAWGFAFGGSEWGSPHTLDMTVYRKADIAPAFKLMHFDNPNYLEAMWAKLADKSKIGLCYELSKTINIPINIVTTYPNKNLNYYSTEELLTSFLQGKRIDINAVYQMVNNSPHVDLCPKFISAQD